MRVIVTGSRDWTDINTIYDALDEVVEMNWGVGGREDDPEFKQNFIVVHGANPTGADSIAKRWAEDRGAGVEPHPANWSAYGNQAGPLRNLEMATAGADLCLAFLKDQSRGTRDMINKAITARIRTVIYPI